MTAIRKLVLALACFLPAIAAANPTIEATSTCLTDNTSGKDRKALVKWMFLAISKHPEIASLSASSAEMDAEANRVAGELYTRLIAEDCATEIRAMVEAEGQSSIAKAFEVLGAVAMQELMAHPDVSTAFGELEKNVDGQRIQKVFE